MTALDGTWEAQGLPFSLGFVWTSKLSFSRTHPHTLVRYRCQRTSHCHPSPACGLPAPPARTSGTVDIYPSIGRGCAYALTLLGFGSLDSGLQSLHDSPKSEISRLSGIQLEVWEEDSPAASAMVPPRRLSQRAHRISDEYHDPHEWHDERDKHIMTATFPLHPLPSMQAPFEESMLDATGETGHVPYQAPKRSVKQRQHMLCREETAEELSWNYTYNCHWRHYPKGKYHPLVKTITQIVFGVHLLHQRLEKSVADVADILLKHVNELDGFLQRANDDLENSLKDMLFRHKCLRVPMEHVSEFDRLLEDRAYRAQLLDGNIVIERTITRMSTLLNDYLTDMEIFREANNGLDLYLLNIGIEWTYHNEDVRKIYSAMCGNTGGWSQFLQSLVAKAERLGVVLVQVSSYCNEIEKRCGAASRRSLVGTFLASIDSCFPASGGIQLMQISGRNALLLTKFFKLPRSCLPLYLASQRPAAGSE